MQARDTASVHPIAKRPGNRVTENRKPRIEDWLLILGSRFSVLGSRLRGYPVSQALAFSSFSSASAAGSWDVASQERRTSASLQAAGCVGRVGVEDLANRADARVVQVIDKALQQRPRRRRIVRVQLQPGVDVGANEPCPDRSLMIRGVASPQVAVVLRLVVGMVRR